MQKQIPHPQSKIRPGSHPGASRNGTRQGPRVPDDNTLTVLAYCIAEQLTKQRDGIELPKMGVAGARVRALNVAELLCVVSDFHSPLDRESLPEFVQAFHQVLQRIFTQPSIIPCRFPTVIENEKEFMQFIEGRSEEYRAALSRLRNKVQMDIRIFQPAVSAESRSDPNETSRLSSRASSAMSGRISGKQYLQGKRDRKQEIESGLAALRQAAEPVVDRWIQRDTPGGLRAFVLLERSSLPDFLEKIRQVRTRPGSLARVTGPWPPSEFVEIDVNQLPENEQLR